MGTSKALQGAICRELGLAYPKSRVICSAREAAKAAQGFTFPVVVKPNVGGSGTGIRKFERMADLEEGASSGTIDLGVDHTGLVQEFLPAKDGHIVRVEIMNHEFLYAIRLPVLEESFNYCPADGCHITGMGYCPADGGTYPERELKIEACVPPPDTVEAAKQIMAVSKADLGGVEYLISERDDRVYYYDINPLSNFVADAPNIVGFDPVPRFVDFILERAGCS